MLNKLGSVKQIYNVSMIKALEKDRVNKALLSYKSWSSNLRESLMHLKGVMMIQIFLDYLSHQNNHRHIKAN